jgi:methionine-rich copper-binding protein CopC
MKATQKYVLSMMFAAATAAGYTSAWAHAILQSATPAKDAAVATSPKEVTLKFNENLEGAFSSAKVIDSTGKMVTTEKATLDQSDPSVMKLTLPTLVAGQYNVEYVAVGQDGHRRKGNYSFTVK